MSPDKELTTDYRVCSDTAMNCFYVIKVWYDGDKPVAFIGTPIPLYGRDKQALEADLREQRKAFLKPVLDLKELYDLVKENGKGEE